jgi:uncharacterized membrane protein YGL010W
VSFFLYCSLCLLQNHLHHISYASNADYLWKTLLYVHVGSWIAQFVGHGVFEKRAPALLDNLLYTLAAPLFVVVEIMFELGYK